MCNTCKSCGNSSDFYIEDRGMHKALMCSVCHTWVKWANKKDLACFTPKNTSLADCGDIVDFATSLKASMVKLGLSKQEVIKIVSSFNI